MVNGDVIIIRGDEVASLLRGRELEIMETVRAAYEAHGAGDSSLPHSTFLLFPSEPRNRIIALPAYLGGQFEVAGVKWVSSFPGNLGLGLDRASALVVLNSPHTGRPEAIVEGSLISAKRTAAAAALAAVTLGDGRRDPRVGFLGCGLINFETARFLRAARPDLDSFTVYDLDDARARHFAARCRKAFGVGVSVAGGVEELLRSAPLVSMATTAGVPHISDLSACAPGTTVLHTSLRDIAPEAMLACDNVVDDVDHVCRAQTSTHLTEQLVGNRDFIRCTLADILSGRAPARPEPDKVSVFSPFGLGVLDLAVGKTVCDLARSAGRGSVINSFLPSPWAEEGAAGA
ncbi:MAG TPA: 2,3-diaminopropionate biosynthesis protein SbnB [Pyrinomonadaceae bacterium]|jgi:ornithine cyclodeaminase